MRDAELPMLWIAIALGIVEGLTEFLPISSTGHLIITSELLHFTGPRSDVFLIFIQLGAILSVVWEYRSRLVSVAVELPRSSRARGFVWRLLLAFVPSAAVGLLFHDWVLEHLFNPTTVAAALIAGALLILLVEALPVRTRTHDVDSLGWRQAAAVGLAQCLAVIWPGFSRSAATILGGLTVGLDRRTATEFSFFLAIPTMVAATFYSLFTSYRLLEPSDLAWLGLSFAVSFVIAWASIRWLLHYVSTHSFRLFAWYRLAFGVLILFVLSR
jgi:undecaprenyl-diphosphatase